MQLTKSLCTCYGFVGKLILWPTARDLALRSVDNGKELSMFTAFGRRRKKTTSQNVWINLFFFFFARQLIGSESLEVIAFFGAVCLLILDGCMGD